MSRYRLFPRPPTKWYCQTIAPVRAVRAGSRGPQLALLLPAWGGILHTPGGGGCQL